MVVTNDINIVVSAKDQTKKPLKNISKGFWKLKDTIHQNKESFKNFWIAVVWATAAIWVIWKQFLTLATDVETTLWKADVVFWDYINWVKEIAKETAWAMWLSQTEYLKAAAWIQDLLIPMWFAREEATWMTTDLMWLSWALSEWSAWQYTASQVWDILAKAMLWEREQLKWLGIAISEADVSQRLLEMWMANLTWIQLQQAKATATQQLIFEKSTDAQKAYEEWWSSLTRQQAEMTATIKDAKDSIALALIPAFNQLLITLKPVIENITTSIKLWAENKENIEQVKNTVITTIEVLKTIWKVIWNIIWFLTKMWEMFWYVAAEIVIFSWTAIEKVQNVWNTIQEVWWAVKEFTISVFESIKETVIWKIQAIIDFAMAAIDKVTWAFKKIVEVKNKIASTVSNIWSSISWAASNVWNLISWARATWWPVTSWWTYLVWEKWPKLFTPSKSWNIIPNNQLWMNWWSININMWWVAVNNDADENRLVEKIKSELTRTLQLQKMGIS